MSWMASFPIPQDSRQSFLYYFETFRLALNSLGIHFRATCIIPSISDSIPISAIELSLRPLNSYFTEVFTFAEDATTNKITRLSLAHTAGLVE